MLTEVGEGYFVEMFAAEDIHPCRRWSWIAYMADGVEIAARGIKIGTSEEAYAEALRSFAPTDV